MATGPVWQAEPPCERSNWSYWRIMALHCEIRVTGRPEELKVNDHRLKVGGFGFRLKVDVAAKAA